MQPGKNQAVDVADGHPLWRSTIGTAPASTELSAEATHDSNLRHVKKFHD